LIGVWRLKRGYRHITLLQTAPERPGFTFGLITNLKGFLISVWISIEQSVMISGIVYLFLGFVVHDWSCAVELTNYGGPHWGIDNCRLAVSLSF